MIDSYDSFSYGPFHVCYGELTANSNKFTCRQDLLPLSSSGHELLSHGRGR